jgi:membrane protein YqaA with SNARE-associated domain
MQQDAVLLVAAGAWALVSAGHAQIGEPFTAVLCGAVALAFSGLYALGRIERAIRKAAREGFVPDDPMPPRRADER